MWEMVLVLALMLVVALLLTIAPRRSDLIALLPVLILPVAGLLTPAEAFSGFVSNAVIVLISAFVLTKGIFSTGTLDRLAELIFKWTRSAWASLAGLLLLVTTVSAFFSDTGTILLMLPVAHRLCRRFSLPPSRVMMPLSFATMLSGAVTLTAASSNLVIANYVSSAGLGELAFFGLSPAGIAITTSGMVLLILLSSRLLPARYTDEGGKQYFKTAEYLTEVKVAEGSPLVGQRALAAPIGPGLPPIGAIRRGKSMFSPTERVTIRQGDRLLLRVDPRDLKEITLAEGLELAHSTAAATDLLEVVVSPNSEMLGRSVGELGLEGDEASVVGISRKGLTPTGADLSQIRLQVGDVLLIRGSDSKLRKALKGLGSLPLEDRGVVVFNRKNTYKVLAIFGFVIVISALQLLPVAVAFALGAFASVLLGVVSIREAYGAIEWPLVVLIGGLLSLGAAMEKTGAAEAIAQAIVSSVGSMGPVAVVVFLLLIAIALTSVINNAAVAAILAPVALLIAQVLDSNPMTLLVAVAVGCSMSFMLPYSHQCNLLVQGPGGYETKDYFRLGLPLLIVIVPVAIGVILLVWPP